MSVKNRVKIIATEVATEIATKIAASLNDKIKATTDRSGKVTKVDGANITVTLADRTEVRALAVGDRPIGEGMTGTVVGGRFYS